MGFWRATALALPVLVSGCGGLEGLPSDSYDLVLRPGHGTGESGGVARLRRDVVIAGIPCRGGTVVTVNRRGQLEHFTLAKDHSLRHVRMSEGTEVWFDLDASSSIPPSTFVFRSLKLMTVEGLAIQPDQRIGVDANGHVNRAWAARLDVLTFSLPSIGARCCRSEKPLGEIAPRVVGEANRLAARLVDGRDASPVVWVPKREGCAWRFGVEFSGVSDTAADITVDACSSEISSSSISGGF